MCSSTHLSDSTGGMPQFVGQVESSSTMEKPKPRTWVSNAMRIAFFAMRMFFGSCRLRRTTYPTPSIVAIISDIHSNHEALKTVLAEASGLIVTVVLAACPLESNVRTLDGSVASAIWTEPTT